MLLPIPERVATTEVKFDTSVELMSARSAVTLVKLLKRLLSIANSVADTDVKFDRRELSSIERVADTERN